MAKLTFENAPMSTAIDPIVHTVTQGDVNRYGVGVIDLHPIHVNQAWCEVHKVFGPRTVAHGMLTLSFMTSTILRWCAKDGGYITALDVKYLKGVYPGDTITCNAKLVEKHLIRETENYVTFEMNTVNQEGVTVAWGKIDVHLDDK